VKIDGVNIIYGFEFLFSPFAPMTASNTTEMCAPNEESFFFNFQFFSLAVPCGVVVWLELRQ
jgi:hypothetical protein